jgi:hypothetical protein
MQRQKKMNQVILEQMQAINTQLDKLNAWEQEGE